MPVQDNPSETPRPRAFPHARFARSAVFAQASFAIGILGAALFILPPTAYGESALKLRAEEKIAPIRATTFDHKAKAVGISSFEVRTDEAGRQIMQVTMAIEGGGSNISEAIFIPTEPIEPIEATAPAAASVSGAADPRAVRLVEERSQSRTAEGKILPQLIVDHERGRVSCVSEGQDLASGQHLNIEGEDRVINVPMQLFFLPLVRGEVEQLNFQIAACGDEPVLHSMIAVRRTVKGTGGREIVRIEYGPDLGKTIAFFAARLLPKFSFWFDPDTHEYMGHQMPLHRKGPEVLLVREDLTPLDLGVK